MNNKKNRSKFASTILHEAIHAEVYRYVDQYQNGTDPNERKNLLSIYFHYKAQNDNTFLTAIAQHQYMQDTFITPLAKAMRQLDNYRYPIEDYIGFAWDGLKDDYDEYIDSNGQTQVMTPTEYQQITNRSYTISNSSNFGTDCN